MFKQERSDSDEEVNGGSAHDYDRIISKPFVFDDNQYSGILRDYYYVLSRINQPANCSSSGTPRSNKGWKIYISISDTDMPKAWNLVKDIFIEHGVYRSKVFLGEIAADRKNKADKKNNANNTSSTSDADKNIRTYISLHELNGELENSDGEQSIVKGLESGKQIVIYASLQPELDWDAIGHEITLKLLEKNVTPSCCPFGNEPCKNNAFLSYRNDSDRNGKYQKVTGQCNPHGYEKYEKLGVAAHKYDNMPIPPSWEEVNSCPLPNSKDEEIIEAKNEVIDETYVPILPVNNSSSSKSNTSRIFSKLNVSTEDPMMQLSSDQEKLSSEDSEEDSEQQVYPIKSKLPDIPVDLSDKKVYDSNSDNSNCCNPGCIIS